MNEKAREAGKRQKDLNDVQEIGAMVKREINLKLAEQMDQPLSTSRPSIGTTSYAKHSE